MLILMVTSIHGLNSVYEFACFEPIVWDEGMRFQDQFIHLKIW